MRYKDYKDIKESIPIKKPDNVSEEQWNRAVSLYTVAKNRGDRYPELTVSQAILETGWFKSPSGKYNFFGQKASKNQQGTVKTTQEVANDSFYTTQAKFRDYDSLQDAVDDRIKKWGSKYKDAPTINDAIYKIWQYDEETGQGKGYATDNMYDRKLKSILRNIGVDLNYKGNVKSDKIDLVNPTAQREETVRESTYVDPKLTEKMINFVNRSQNSTFVTPPLPNIGEEKIENKETEAAKEVLEEKKNEERFIQDILSNKIQPINTQQQPRQQTPQPFGSHILNKAKELGIF